jgi:hypothetical protein
LEDALESTFARIAALPPDLVLAIFRRYGRPLEVKMPAPAADDRRVSLALSGGGAATVRVLQVLGYGDVIPNDYFVLEGGPDGQGDPLAVPGPHFAGALGALARAAGVV